MVRVGHNFILAKRVECAGKSLHTSYVHFHRHSRWHPTFLKSYQPGGTGEKEYVQTNLPMEKAVPTRIRERASFISDGEVELVCIRG